jgi:dihydrofolate synthase/folylpolyglutamate synthase
VLTAQDFKIKNSKLSLSVYQDGKIKYKDLQSDLTGVYQHKNILTVLETLAILNEKTEIKTDQESIYKGISQVKKQTGLQGRWQTLSKNPLVICDTGHNEAGIKEVIKNITQTPYQNLHIVFGMVNDKDISKVLSLMPKNAIYYFCKPDLERGLAANALKEQAAAINLNGNIYASVAKAKATALQAADTNDLIFIGGSTFVVAEAI